jgi:signal transduction histidine kinase
VLVTSREAVREPSNDAAPAVRWQPTDTDEHVVMFYDDERFLLDTLSGYIGTALHAGQRAVVVATPEHRAAAELRLRALGIDVDAAVARHQYVACDARELLGRFMVDGRPCRERFEPLLDGLLAGCTPDRPPRVFGEMVALLADDGLFEAALALEAMWNRARQTRSFALLCGYAMSTFRGNTRAAALESACQEHSSVVPCESYSGLLSREERLREIAALQQKAASLELALAAEREARDQAEAALRTRDEFLSTASHELRTPITVVGVQAQVALRRFERTGELDAERAVSALRKIEVQTNKLGRLVQQLLDVRRLDSGTLVVEREPIDLADLVRQVASLSEALSDRHPISVSAPEELVAFVDPLRLEQVLMNLFDNAIKYSPDGGQIEVLLWREDSEHVCMNVRDHGPGIAAAKRGHIFDRFFQAEPETGRGLGLGLYLCRTIVELHGGELTAEYPPDGGTCFRICLPG